MTDTHRTTNNAYLAGYQACMAEGKAEVAKYRRGNTELIEGLMDMVNQFFYTREDGTLSHSFMGAEENAIETLIKAGFAEELEGCTYRLLWDKLEERIQDEIRTHPQA